MIDNLREYTVDIKLQIRHITVLYDDITDEIKKGV